jgi:hypothetical protein
MVKALRTFFQPWSLLVGVRPVRRFSVATRCVLLAGLQRHVGAGAMYRRTNQLTLSLLATRSSTATGAGGGQRGPLRRLRPQVPRPVLAGLGIDAVHPDNPLVVLAANRWATAGVPPHGPTP